MSKSNLVSTNELMQLLQKFSDPNTMVLFAEKEGTRIRNISCSRCGAGGPNHGEIVHKDCCIYKGGSGC